MTLMSELESNIDYHGSRTISLDPIKSFGLKISDFFKKDLDEYFRIKSSEKSGKRYEFLGVKSYQTLYRNTYQRVLSKIVGEDDIFVLDKSDKGLTDNIIATKAAESLHTVAFPFFLYDSLNSYAQGDMVWGHTASVLNLIINVYPIMLQRHKRNRFEKILEHRANRGASKCQL